MKNIEKRVEIEVLGVGSPVMDFVARVPEEFLKMAGGEKGGMVLVEQGVLEGIVGKLPEGSLMAAGGAAANTTAVCARLGLRTGFVGKVGNDGVAEKYLELMGRQGTDVGRFKRGDVGNARCVSLVTPDGQRTMRTCLGAAMTLGAGEIVASDFEGVGHVFVEGYLLFNPALADAVMEGARAAGCGVSLDLGSFEVVGVAREWILGELRKGISVVFANEDEAGALYPELVEKWGKGVEGLGKFAEKLAENCGGIGVVKMGKDGAWVARKGELVRVGAVVVPAVDTTGAGDTWAGGFLFGWLRGWGLKESGDLGARLAAECVKVLGAKIPEEIWGRVKV